MSFKPDIRVIHKGEVITAEWLNQLRDGVIAARTLQTNGYHTIVNGVGSFSRVLPLSEPGIAFKNVSASTIPAYGVVRISGTTTVDGKTVLVGTIPAIYGSQYSHFINGPSSVPAGSLGRCFNNWGFVEALYERDDGIPAFGELWGPRDGSCKLRKNTPGFSIFGAVDDGNEASGHTTAVVVQHPFLRFTGVAEANVAKGLTGTVSILYGEMGSFLDTGVDMQSVVSNFSDINIGDLVECTWEGDIGGARWQMIAKEC